MFLSGVTWFGKIQIVSYRSRMVLTGSNSSCLLWPVPRATSWCWLVLETFGVRWRSGMSRNTNRYGSGLWGRSLMGRTLWEGGLGGVATWKSLDAVPKNGKFQIFTDDKAVTLDALAWSEQNNRQWLLDICLPAMRYWMISADSVIKSATGWCFMVQ